MLFKFWSLSQALLSTFPSVFLLMQRNSHCLYQLQMEGFLSRGFHLWLYDRIQRRGWNPTPVLLPGKSHGWRSLVGCSPWGHEESDTTEWLHFHFSLSCIGEGNGNPLQCSCLENPRDGGAWWAAISGVAQSWTWLKRLSSSSSSNIILWALAHFWGHGGCFMIVLYVPCHSSTISLSSKEHSYV